MVENSKRLLLDMIRSKKLERQLYTTVNLCGSETLTCLDALIYPVQNKYGSSIVETLLDTYSDGNGIIDTENELSPFSGKNAERPQKENSRIAWILL